MFKRKGGGRGGEGEGFMNNVKKKCTFLAWRLPLAHICNNTFFRNFATNYTNPSTSNYFNNLCFLNGIFVFEYY